MACSRRPGTRWQREPCWSGRSCPPIPKLCSDPEPDTPTWPEVVVPLASAEVEGLRLRLPRHYQAAEHDPTTWIGSAGREHDQTRFELVTASGEQTHLTVGTGPLASQVSVNECQVSRDGGVRLHLLTFTLRDGPIGREEDRFYVSAVWPIRAGVWLMGTGDAHQAEEQQEIVSIFRTVRFQGRR